MVPVSQIRSLFPILRHPSERHKAVGFTKEQFHYAFANTLSREESDEVYERYHTSLHLAGWCGLAPSPTSRLATRRTT